MNKKEIKIIGNGIGELFENSTPKDDGNVAYYSMLLFLKMLKEIPKLKEYLINNEMTEAVEFLSKQ